LLGGVRQTSTKRTDGPSDRARWSQINFNLMDRHATSPPYRAKELSFFTLITLVDFYNTIVIIACGRYLMGILPRAGLQPRPAQGIIAQVDVIRRGAAPPIGPCGSTMGKVS
jgi:hypothetical protein